MTKRKAAFATLVAAISIPAAADARTQMRAVGSSTVYPFAKVVAERIARANPRLGTPIIESTGTGAGMKLFCPGVGERFPDVENASRRMKASEAKMCAANGVTQITEIQVGIDGISRATSKRSPLANLTQRDIYLAIAKTPFGDPDPRLRPAADQRHARRAWRADHDPAMRSECRPGRPQEERREQVQG